MGPLEEKRANLERKIEELRTFEREYRTRFRSDLESHLRDLDSRGSAEPPSARRQTHAGGGRRRTPRRPRRRGPARPALGQPADAARGGLRTHPVLPSLATPARAPADRLDT